MVKDLFGLPAWNSNLYGNLWHIIALFYPLYFIYVVAAGAADSIVEEERLETIVYLNNLSIGRDVVLMTKVAERLVISFISCLVLAVENSVFFLLLRSGQMAVTVIKYYTALFLIGWVYIAIAIFVASYSKTEKGCEDKIFAIMIIPFLSARLYAVIGFFGDLLVATGREGKIVDVIGVVSDKLQVLTLISPITWCWPSVQVRGLYVLCGIVVIVFLVTIGYSIYTSDVIYRDR